MAEEETGDGASFRTFWSGTITFGLVSVPVALMPATRPRSGSLRLVAPDGAPVQRTYVCSKDDKPLDDDDIVRGYEVEKGKFVVVSDEELEAIEPRKSREIDLRLFVNLEEIDPKFFERAWFLTPSGGSNKAYRLLAEVMEKKGRAGIATFVMRTKEYLVAIIAEKGILRAETLRFQDEIRKPEDASLPKRAKVKPAEVTKIERAIASHSGKVDFKDFLDEYSQRLEKLAEKKRKRGEDVIEAPEEERGEGEGGEVIDLLAALRKSLGNEAPRRPSRARQPSRRKARG